MGVSLDLRFRNLPSGVTGQGTSADLIDRKSRGRSKTNISMTSDPNNTLITDNNFTSYKTNISVQDYHKLKQFQHDLSLMHQQVNQIQSYCDDVNSKPSELTNNDELKPDVYFMRNPRPQEF